MDGTVTDYFQGLPSWGAFAPDVPEQAPTPTGDPTDEEPVTLDVEVVEEDGSTSVLRDVTYSCTSTPYSLAETPEDIVIYDPDRSILYPGAFVQGKGYVVGSIDALTIPERAELRISIPDIANPNGPNFRTVTPNQAEVSNAVGDIVGNAVQDGLDTPSAIDFKMETYHSESQFALQARVSGRYLNYSGSASGSYSRNASETTVAVQFTQRMYTVAVERPAADPASFFTDAFTPAKLEALRSRGQIGPDNLPVYVSEVVYGRMMMFTLTSTASETDIRATLQAAYNSIGGDVQGSLSARQRSLLQNSKVTVTSYGGNAEATLAMIRSGNWADYFTEDAPLSSASPLSYTFRNVGDNSVAAVTEATDYTVRTCDARQATPGTFELRDGQALSLSFAPEAGAAGRALADATGDGRGDLVFSRATSSGIQAAVAAGDGSGGFGTPVSGTAAGDWQDAFFLTGDVDGRAGDELVWVRTTSAALTVQVGRASGGAVTFLRPQERTGSWAPYRKAGLGDVDGDGRDDLVVNQTDGEGNFVYVFFADADGTFDLGASSRHEVSRNPGFGDYALLVMDYTGDGRADLVWNRMNGDGNLVHRAPAKPSRDASAPVGPLPSFLDFGFSGWGNYARAVGQFNPSNGEDLAFVRRDGKVIHRAYSTGSSFSLSRGDNFQTIDLLGDGGNLEYVLAGDVNADGVDDLIANDLDATTNRTYVLLGQSDGIFDASSRVPQTHPDAGISWGTYVPLVGELTGDARADVVWVSEAGTRLYVGLARE